MTTGYREDLQSLGSIGAVMLHGSFAPNGSSAVDPTSIRGAGFSVVRTSTGLFTVTLDKAYTGLISALCALQTAAASRLALRFGAIDVVTAKTVVLRLDDVYGSTPGTPEVADLAANASNRIFFSLQLKDSTARDATGLVT